MAELRRRSGISYGGPVDLLDEGYIERYVGGEDVGFTCGAAADKDFVGYVAVDGDGYERAYRSYFRFDLSGLSLDSIAAGTLRWYVEGIDLYQGYPTPSESLRIEYGWGAFGNVLCTAPNPGSNWNPSDMWLLCILPWIRWAGDGVGKYYEHVLTLTQLRTLFSHESADQRLDLRFILSSQGPDTGFRVRIPAGEDIRLYPELVLQTGTLLETEPLVAVASDDGVLTPRAEAGAVKSGVESGAAEARVETHTIHAAVDSGVVGGVRVEDGAVKAGCAKRTLTLRTEEGA